MPLNPPPSFDLSGKVALVTGGSRGLGREMVAGFAQAGADVVIASRDAAACAAYAAEITAATGRRALPYGVHVGHWDELDGLVKAAYEAFGRVDVLVNNAGMEGRGPGNSVVGAAELTAETMRETFETNVFGMVRVTHAFLPLLQRSAAPVVVNLSSGLASLTRVTDPGTPAYAYPGVAYPASKAAVNMLTVQYAKAFPGIRINAVEPGYTATDLNGNTGVQTVEQGAEIIVRMAQLGPDGPTGGYFDAEGPLPW